MAYKNIDSIEKMKEETQGEEGFENPFSIHQETENIIICEDVKKEIKLEENEDLLLVNQDTKSLIVC